ncbi:16S rRNA (uracil(1498)-N(3))-methyltransferase [Amnibacterium flavum]|uniref:Ribosomal RNA small subunit methyltransferase E n=1 Tax=Amnibacterium flavum TaxID=2173173 RepID=A0A2V1HR37_9MICO|nr:16S rRNA (uracil(1498)-N(3))-methyltransferase [Amnibacterium flavum]PVZ94112.1 16S rRNA (uracil(1498)-N(3))-methyltransferase [Amnibacterium flavum]
MVAHFYLTESEIPAVGGTATLTGAEAKHASSVARLRVDEQVLVGDGVGSIGQAVVLSSTPQLVELEVVALDRHDRPARTITLVQALAKGDRDELAIQAATELGVDRVVPWQAERSVSRWNAAKAERGVERWRSIVHEAVKQSIRPWLPEVGELASTKDVARLASDATVLVLEPAGGVALVDALTTPGRHIVLVVGPEGGISPGELDALTSAGAHRVRLGPEVLRTSTAGPAAIAAISALTGRWA